MSARRWMAFLMPDALAVHVDWLRNLVQGDEGLLAHVTRGGTAARMLTRKLYQKHGIAVPDRAVLSSKQQWLLLSQPRQVALARALGVEALHGYIRTTVDAKLVGILRGLLGEEGYRQALAGQGLQVQGLDATALTALLRGPRPEDCFVAVGVALLETTVETADPFCRMRMRFAFSPACWRARPGGLSVDEVQLEARICVLTEA